MPILSFLKPEDTDAVHAATLRILSETGILLRNKEGRELLAGAGARIEGDVVLIPPELVETCLEKCPTQVSVRGRGGSVKTLGDDRLYRP